MFANSSTTTYLSSKHGNPGCNFCFNTRRLISNDRASKLIYCLSFQTPAKGNISSGEKLFKYSHENFKRVEVQALVDLMHQCAEERSLTEAKAIHGHILKCNLADDILLVLLNHVMHAYSKCSDFGSAGKVFTAMSQKNVFSWTVMIVGCTENGLLHDSFKYFSEMQQYGIEVDAFAFSAVLKSCIGLNRLDLGEIVHAQIIVRGFISHVFVSTSLLSMYAKLGEAEHSLKVFNNMTVHNDVSWNAMISGLLANGLYLEAFNYFLLMIKDGFSPDVYSFISVLKAIGMLGDVGKGKQVHLCASELNMVSNVRVGTALIDMYSKCHALEDARAVFERNFSQCRLNMPWNAMIGGYSDCNHSQEALDLYIKMCENNVMSDVYTYCSVFDTISDLKCFKFLRQVHAMVLKAGCDSVELSIENAIADAYSKCASLEDVRKVFDRLKQRDLVSWTVLIGAYCQCFAWEEAVIAFFQMREEGWRPNEFTFSTILTACAGLCYLDLGQQLHALLYKSGLGTDNCVNSALVDVYAKCGCLTEARKVFDCISRPDVVSWTAIISGYAQHGCATDALQLFSRMENLNIRANAVTLLCILFACSHVGMVKEGLEYFWSMTERYDLEPQMEHYACIVDLLGRVGHLNEAFQFIKAMPIQPDEIVWQALLAGSRIHGNIELGEIAAKEILSTQPKYSAAYVLLSNTYMERGSSRDGLQWRKLMKEQGVKKEPGYSSISLKGRVHTFYAGDQEHPQKDEIYLKLAEIRKMLKLHGYVPDLKYALQSED